MDPTQWLEAAIKAVTRLAPARTFLSYDFNVSGLLAVILVCLICGAVGSLVVGNRMAFFSDALAHCAFAGVALGLLIGVFVGARKDSDFYRWGLPVMMVGFGAMVGLGIAFVREKSALASDTVIGVFFAGAIGFGAMFFKLLNTQTFLSPEMFLFGDPLRVDRQNLFVLLVLTLVVFGVISWVFNPLVFTSFNVSLARSRRVRVRLCNYVFIVLLALIVNLCLTTVGALLINGMLIVPAATASNLCRNMRQLFLTTVALSLLVGVLGPWLSWEVAIKNPSGGDPIYFGWTGTIVVLGVLLFAVSLFVGPRVRGKQAA